MSRALPGIVIALAARAALGAGAPDADSASLREIHSRLGRSVVRVEAVVRKQLDNGVDVDLEVGAIGVVVKPGLIMTPSEPFKDEATLDSRIASIAVIASGGARFDATLSGIESTDRLAFLSVVDPRFSGVPVEFSTDDTLDVGDFFATLRLSGPSFRFVPYVDAFLVSAITVDPSPRCYVTTYAIADYLGAPVVAFDGRVVGIVNRVSLLARASRTDSVTGQSELDLFADVAGFDGDGEEVVVVPASRFAKTLANPPSNDQSNAQSNDPSSGPRAPKPWLGIETQPLLPELAAALGVPAERHGVLVTRVLPGSPAAAAELRIGDLVFAVGGVALATGVSSADDGGAILAARLAERAPGDVVELSVLRGDLEFAAKTTLVATPPALGDAKKSVAPDFGISARDLVYLDRADLDLPLDSTGARATVVKRTGFAGIAGLRVGDVIREVDGNPVQDAADLAEKLESVTRASAASARLFVTRGVETLFIDMRLL